MKKITLNLLKGLLVIVLFTGVSVALPTTGVQTVNEVNAKVIGVPQGSKQSGQKLTAIKINQYLIDKGYDVYSVTPIAGSKKFRAVIAGSDGTKTFVIDEGVIDGGTNSIVSTQETAL